MFSIQNQEAYSSNPFILLPKSVAIYPPQPNFFHQQYLNPYHFQPSYGDNILNFNNFNKDNELKLNNPLDYYKIQQATNTKNYGHHIPPHLKQEKIADEFCLNNNFSKSARKSVSNRNKNKNTNNSNLVLIDLSNIKILPPQEKLSMEELKETKRKHKRWTVEEDQLLCELKTDPRLNWREIAKYFPLRTLKACQFRVSRLKSIEKLKREH